MALPNLQVRNEGERWIIVDADCGAGLRWDKYTYATEAEAQRVIIDELHEAHEQTMKSINDMAQKIVYLSCIQ